MARVKKLVPEDALGYGFAVEGDYTWEIIGESTRTDECFAYLVGWVVRCIEEVNNYNSSSSLDERTPELIELIPQDEHIGVNIDTES